MSRRMDRSKVVVVLEQDPETRHLLASSLQDRGYYVVAVESGGRALEILQQVRARLIILDRNQLEVDGNQLLQALNADEKTRDLQVIALSGDAAPARRGPTRGASQLRGQPFDVEHILHRVETLIGKAEVEEAHATPVGAPQASWAFAE